MPLNEPGLKPHAGVTALTPSKPFKPDQSLGFRCVSADNLNPQAHNLPLLQADGQLRGLSVDEAAAIALYTAESEFYRTLNVLLRNRSREALKPFFPYLRLLLQARSKLPKHTQSVWRGVKGVDLTGSFPKGKKIFWWAFNSTSKNVSTLLNPMFCGTSGTRTQFMIEAVSGIDIAHYSMVDSEAEVLLFPGTKLEVVDVADMGHGLFQVHLREVKVPVQLIK